MKNLKLLANTFIAFLLFFAANTQAQGDYLATPSTASEVANQIFNDFELAIDITLEEIDQHLNELVLPATFCAECPYTTLMVNEITADEVYLEWPIAEGEVKYEIRLQNLSTGEILTFHTPNNDLVVGNLPDAAYAVSITILFSGEEPATGPSNIIVLEKPILRILDPGQNCPCDQSTVIASVIRGNSQNPYLKLPWNPMMHRNYYLKVNYGVQLNSSTQFKVIPDISNTVPYLLRINCLANLDPAPVANTFWPQASGTNYSLHIEPNDYSWTIMDNNLVINSATLYDCVNTRPQHRQTLLPTTPELLILPNPADDYIRLNFSESSETPLRLIITDSMGRIKYTNQSFTNQEVISVSDWQKGIYHATIFQNGNRTSQSFSIVK